MLTTVPNYRLWVEDVNKAGGLMLKKYGRRIPIEVTEIDDHSDNIEMVRLVERLMRDDKADIVLSPWGTGPNLQAAPTFHKYGYPQIMGTAGSNDIDKLVERFSTLFWFLGPPAEQVQAAVDFLSEQVKQGVLQISVAMFTVQHPFGAENGDAAQLVLAKAGFKIVYETTYPLGVADLSEQIQAAKAAGPDSLLARLVLSARHIPDHRAGARKRLQSEIQARFGRRRLPDLQGKVRRQDQWVVQSRRAQPQGACDQGMVRAPQGGEQGCRARPLGQRQYLCRT
jgi:ABC-type branched-subunit amino acid transport system substrate-binding protein